MDELPVKVLHDRLVVGLVLVGVERKLLASAVIGLPQRGKCLVMRAGALLDGVQRKTGEAS